MTNSQQALSCGQSNNFLFLFPLKETNPPKEKVKEDKHGPRTVGNLGDHYMRHSI